MPGSCPEWMAARCRRLPRSRRSARHGLRAGLGVDAAQALPLYLRDKVALKTSERAQR